MFAKRTGGAVRQLMVVGSGLAAVLGLAAALPHPKEAARPDEGRKKDAVRVEAAGKQAVQLEVDPVRLEALDGALETSGTISTPADATVKVTPSLQGRVRQVLVHVGQSVRKGQVLAVLDSVDAANAVNSLEQSRNKLRLAKLNLDRQERLFRLGTPDVTAARANLEQARQALETAKISLEQNVTQAQANLDSARQRQKYADTALAQQQEQADIGGFTQKPLADAQNGVVAARVSVTQSRADYVQADKELARTRKLKELGLATDRDLVAAQNSHDKTKVGLEGAQESLTLAQDTYERELKAFHSGLYRKQALESALSARRQADLDVQAGQTALKLAREQGQAAVRQAELGRNAAEKSLTLAEAQIQRDLQQARSDYQNAEFDTRNAERIVRVHGVSDPKNVTVPLLSPISGTVVERNVNPGQVVDTSTLTPWQMFTITDFSRVWVDADVYERDLARVKLGDAVRVRVASLPDRTFAGTVTYLVPGVSATSRTLKVRTEIPNPGGILKPGMFADVSLSAGSGPRVPVIPVSAVQVDGDTDYVYVETADHRYRKRTVHLGPEKHGLYAVRDGLRTGERVVTHGGLFLAAEQSS